MTVLQKKNYRDPEEKEANPGKYSPDDLEMTLANLSASFLDLHLELHSAVKNLSFELLDILEILAPIEMEFKG